MAWPLRSLRLPLLLALSLCAADAQPFIFYRGIVNAASFAPAGLPNGSIARGSIFTIFGRNLGPFADAGVSAFPLQTELAGVSIEVCRGESCLQAIPLFASHGQVNAIMPSGAPLGQVSIRVTFNGEAGNFSPVTVVESSLGIFAINSGGFGVGVIQNFVAQDNQPLNSLSAAARPGQVVTLWATGLGAGLNEDNVAPRAGNLPVKVEIFVGGKRVNKKLYTGRSPCCAGVDQINFEVPADTPSGCWVPIQIRTDNQVVSNSVTMAIDPQAKACSNPFNFVAQSLPLNRKGTIYLEQSVRYDETQDGSFLETRADFLTATFREESSSVFFFEPNSSLPPVGTCMVYSGKGGFSISDPIPGAGRALRELDAGDALTVNFAGGVAQAQRRGGTIRVYRAQLEGGAVGLRREGVVAEQLAPVLVTGSGGTDVGTFNVSLPPTTALTWTNLDDVETIDRGLGFTVTWQGGEPVPEMVWVWGGGMDAASNAQTIFSCLAPAAPGAFTVPAYVLANVSPTRGIESYGWVVLTGLNPSTFTTFTASGLNSGYAASLARVGRSVGFR